MWQRWIWRRVGYSPTPNQQTVTLTLALMLKQHAAGKRYTVELLATADDGTMQGPEVVGTLAVGPFTMYLSLGTR